MPDSLHRGNKIIWYVLGCTQDLVSLLDDPIGTVQFVLMEVSIEKLMSSFVRVLPDQTASDEFLNVSNTSESNLGAIITFGSNLICAFDSLVANVVHFLFLI